ncbi:hypothetical protein QOT17_019736 [Balamuthia mandrillaris]
MTPSTTSSNIANAELRRRVFLFRPGTFTTTRKAQLLALRRCGDQLLRCPLITEIELMKPVAPHAFWGWHSSSFFLLSESFSVEVGFNEAHNGLPTAVETNETRVQLAQPTAYSPASVLPSFSFSPSTGDFSQPMCLPTHSAQWALTPVRGAVGITCEVEWPSPLESQ